MKCVASPLADIAFFQGLQLILEPLGEYNGLSMGAPDASKGSENILGGCAGEYDHDAHKAKN